MQQAASLVSLLVLGWTCTLQGLPVVPEPPVYPTQENFDVTKFLGTWHEIAVASMSPHILRMEANSAKIVLESTAEDKINGVRTTFRNGTCEQIAAVFQMSNTPGRFLFHVAKWGVDVDIYVTHTDYNEYAIMKSIQHWPNGEKKTLVKLYSRATDVRAPVLEDFKTVAREMGMSDENIVIKANEGDCVPGEQEE